jgi:hypothetical protein
LLFLVLYLILSFPTPTHFTAEVKISESFHICQQTRHQPWVIMTHHHHHHHHHHHPFVHPHIYIYPQGMWRANDAPTSLYSLTLFTRFRSDIGSFLDVILDLWNLCQHVGVDI